MYVALAALFGRMVIILTCSLALCEVERMTARERREFVVARYEELYPGRGDELDSHFRSFVYKRNRICHNGTIRTVPHEDFLQDENAILAKLDELVRVAPA